MARRTDGEKIDELEKLVATLQERLNYSVELIEELFAVHSRGSEIVADVRRQVERELLLQSKAIESLNEWKKAQKQATEERGKKLFSLGPPVLGAIVNVLLAAIVAYLVSRR